MKKPAREKNAVTMLLNKGFASFVNKARETEYSFVSDILARLNKGGNQTVKSYREALEYVKDRIYQTINPAHSRSAQDDEQLELKIKEVIKKFAEAYTLPVSNEVSKKVIEEYKQKVHELLRGTVIGSALSDEEFAEYMSQFDSYLAKLSSSNDNAAREKYKLLAIGWANSARAQAWWFASFISRGSFFLDKFDDLRKPYINGLDPETKELVELIKCYNEYVSKLEPPRSQYDEGIDRSKMIDIIERVAQNDQLAVNVEYFKFRNALSAFKLKVATDLRDYSKDAFIFKNISDAISLYSRCKAAYQGVEIEKIEIGQVTEEQRKRIDRMILYSCYENAKNKANGVSGFRDQNEAKEELDYYAAQLGELTDKDQLLNDDPLLCATLYLEKAKNTELPTVHKAIYKEIALLYHYTANLQQRITTGEISKKLYEQHLKKAHLFAIHCETTVLNPCLTQQPLYNSSNLANYGDNENADQALLQAINSHIAFVGDVRLNKEVLNRITRFYEKCIEVADREEPGLYKTYMLKMAKKISKIELKMNNAMMKNDFDLQEYLYSLLEIEAYLNSAWYGVDMEFDAHDYATSTLYHLHCSVENAAVQCVNFATTGNLLHDVDARRIKYKILFALLSVVSGVIAGVNAYYTILAIAGENELLILYAACFAAVAVLALIYSLYDKPHRLSIEDIPVFTEIRNYIGDINNIVKKIHEELICTAVEEQVQTDMKITSKLLDSAPKLVLGHGGMRYPKLLHSRGTRAPKFDSDISRNIFARAQKLVSGAKDALSHPTQGGKYNAVLQYLNQKMISEAQAVNKELYDINHPLDANSIGKNIPVSDVIKLLQTAHPILKRAEMENVLAELQYLISTYKHYNAASITAIRLEVRNIQSQLMVLHDDISMVIDPKLPLQLDDIFNEDMIGRQLFDQYEALKKGEWNNAARRQLIQGAIQELTRKLEQTDKSKGAECRNYILMLIELHKQDLALSIVEDRPLWTNATRKTCMRVASSLVACVALIGLISTYSIIDLCDTIDLEAPNLMENRDFLLDAGIILFGCLLGIGVGLLIFNKVRQFQPVAEDDEVSRAYNAYLESVTKIFSTSMSTYSAELAQGFSEEENLNPDPDELQL